ncbi:hypothetical protein ACLBR5_20225 [Escherichia coli]
MKLSVWWENPAAGKSVTAMLIMRLLPTGSYCVHRGQIFATGRRCS